MPLLWSLDMLSRVLYLLTYRPYGALKLEVNLQIFHKKLFFALRDANLVLWRKATSYEKVLLSKVFCVKPSLAFFRRGVVYSLLKPANTVSFLARQQRHIIEIASEVI